MNTEKESILVLDFLFFCRQFKAFQNDALGCNAVSWAPYNAIGPQSDSGVPVKRLVTASCDNRVRMWKFEGDQWAEERKKEEQTHSGTFLQCGSITASTPFNFYHNIFAFSLRVRACVALDWVRDVAWAPNTAMPYNIIASCSEDRKVVIWKQTVVDGEWDPQEMQTFEAPVWRVSWSVTGNVLAVSTGDHKVSLWKQSVDESWVQISDVEGTQN